MFMPGYMTWHRALLIRMPDEEKEGFTYSVKAGGLLKKRICRKGYCYGR